MTIKKYDRAVKAVNRFNNILLVIALTGMFIILMLQIISRLTPLFILPWAQDMIIFMLMTSVFLGAGSATDVDKHIRLEFFIHFFRKNTARICLIIADIISILFLGVVCYQAAVLGAQALRTTMGASPVPLGVYYWVVGFGSLVMLLNSINLVIKRVCRQPVGQAPEADAKGGEDK